MRKRNILFPPAAAGKGRRAAMWFLQENYMTDPLFICQWFDTEVERVVARKTGGKGRNASGNWNQDKGSWKGFKNYSLTTDDKEQIRAGVIDHDLLWDVVLSLGVNGHKVTLTCDPQKGQWTASATGVSDECPNNGYTLTAFGNDPVKALIVLAYKHEFIFKGEWGADKPTDDEDFG